MGSWHGIICICKFGRITVSSKVLPNYKCLLSPWEYFRQVHQTQLLVCLPCVMVNCAF